MTQTVVLYPAYRSSEHPPPGVPNDLVFSRQAAEIIDRSPAEEYQKSLVRAMLLHAPTLRGRMSIAWAVCELPRGEQDVARLADFLFDAIINPRESYQDRACPHWPTDPCRAVRVASKSTRLPSTNVSQCVRFDVESPVLAGSAERGQEKIRAHACFRDIAQCLKRDGSTCPITKRFLWRSAGAVHIPPHADPDSMVAAHILPISPNRFNLENDEVCFYE
jgi:hypothetical protein